jgi:ABC-type multidrug transport system fused ATPase/permease subunit
MTNMYSGVDLERGAKQDQAFMVKDWSFLTIFYRILRTSETRWMILWSLLHGLFSLACNISFLYFSAIITTDKDLAMKYVVYRLMFEIGKNWTRKKMQQERGKLQYTIADNFTKMVFELIGKAEYKQIRDQDNGALIKGKMTTGLSAHNTFLRTGLWRIMDIIQGMTEVLVIFWISPPAVLLVIAVNVVLFYFYSYEYHTTRGENRKEVNKFANKVSKSSWTTYSNLMNSIFHGNLGPALESIRSQNNKVKAKYLEGEQGWIQHDWISGTVQDCVKYAVIYWFIWGTQGNVSIAKFMPLQTALGKMTHLMINIFWFYGSYNQITTDFFGIRDYVEKLVERPIAKKQGVQDMLSLKIDTTLTSPDRDDFRLTSGGDYFDILPGWSVLLAGSTGNGKTTTLESITGILPGASVKIDGVEMPHGVHHLHVLFSPQDNEIKGTGSILKIFGLISFDDDELCPGEVRQTVKKDEEDMIIKVLEMVHLTDLISTLQNGLYSKLGKISGGQSSRLALAYTLFLAKKALKDIRQKGDFRSIVLILDEPYRGIPESMIVPIQKGVHTWWCTENNNIIFGTTHSQISQKQGWDFIIHLSHGIMTFHSPIVTDGGYKTPTDLLMLNE